MKRLRNLTVTLVLAVLPANALAEPTTGNGGGIFAAPSTVQAP